MYMYMQIPGRKNASIEVQYKGHRIEPCDAVLLLVAESGCGTYGTSMAFHLQGRVTGAKPQVHLHLYVSICIRCVCGGVCACVWGVCVVCVCIMASAH